MKILILNTYDYGGAATACIRLHKGLLLQGLESVLLVKHKTRTDIPFLYEYTHQIETSPRLNFIEKLKNKRQKELKSNSLSERIKFLKDRDTRLEMFSFPESECDITTSIYYKNADIVNLHWVAGFVDYKVFFKKNKKPILWTLHDMNPFSGGEHYQERFLGMDENGLPVSRALLLLEHTLHNKIEKFKAKTLRKINNIQIIAPSQWLASEASRSTVFKNFPIHHIPYGIDSEVFFNTDKKNARTKLGWDQEKKIILFVSQHITNERKGYKYLLEALKSIMSKNTVAYAIGKDKANSSEIKTITSLGEVNSIETLVEMYNAADVFVIPSLMDNLPNTVLESLMCGTPVIGFPVGGIVDMIQHRENGLLTKEISVDALTESINEFLEKGVDLRAIEIRKSAISKYNLDVQAKAYKALFSEIKEQYLQ